MPMMELSDREAALIRNGRKSADVRCAEALAATEARRQAKLATLSPEAAAAEDAAYMANLAEREKERQRLMALAPEEREAERLLADQERIAEALAKPEIAAVVAKVQATRLAVKEG